MIFNWFITMHASDWLSNCVNKVRVWNIWYRDIISLLVKSAYFNKVDTNSTVN